MKKKVIIYMFIFGLFLPFYKLTAGTILGSYKYAWSNNVGYINFENVIVEDNALLGYAWSQNSGWIKFNPVQGGVLNDGMGNLSGSAWGENLGWIDFDNVDIDENGRFSGTASGPLVGIINFDCPNYCDVRTDWSQQSSSEDEYAVSGSISTTNNPKTAPVLVSDATSANLSGENESLSRDILKLGGKIVSAVIFSGVDNMTTPGVNLEKDNIGIQPSVFHKILGISSLVLLVVLFFLKKIK